MSSLPTGHTTASGTISDPAAPMTPEARVKEGGGTFIYYRHYTRARFHTGNDAVLFRSWLLERGGYCLLSPLDQAREFFLVDYCAIKLGKTKQ